MNHRLIAVILLSFSLVFISCNKDDDEDDTINPTITNLEIGMENSKQVARGEELHIEFEAQDDMELGYYEIHIHAETKSGNSEWEIEQRWDFEPGLKNALVHQHEIVVSADADTGEYHFHLTLVDKAGNSVFAEEDIEIIEN